MSETLKKIEDFRRQCLRELLDKCTAEERAFFNRLYGSVDTIAPEKINRAIQQCEATLLKHENG